MNCRFLHHWKWKLILGDWRHANQYPPDDPYWRGKCIFCDAVSNRTASRMPRKGSPYPTKAAFTLAATKAGVSASTGAPVPPLGI